MFIPLLNDKKIQMGRVIIEDVIIDFLKEHRKNFHQDTPMRMKKSPMTALKNINNHNRWKRKNILLASDLSKFATIEGIR
jgi:hypothetical protein